jgi:hypothetical protein
MGYTLKTLVGQHTVLSSSSPIATGVKICHVNLKVAQTSRMDIWNSSFTSYDFHFKCSSSVPADLVRWYFKTDCGKRVIAHPCQLTIQNSLQSKQYYEK